MSTELERRLERIDGLVERLETGTDPVSGATARELVQILMELHGEALDRIVTLVTQAGAIGHTLMERFGQDPVEALDHARPYIDSHGGAVELIGVRDDGSVHLRVQGAASLKGVVEKAVQEAAPDLGAVVVEHQSPVVLLERRR